ncbi:MAG: hypothetical protein GYA36_20995 [Veillonellaceae bacterium]|nr:hypothetical protein [Veillonellaceae bacterium]
MDPTDVAWAEAHAALQSLVDRARRRSSVALPLEFVKGGSDTPLARLLGGGRSGEVRLKLFLTYVMRATRKPYETRQFHSSEAARALALPDPDGKGARRIQAATRWLKNAGFLAEKGDRRSLPQVQILDPRRVPHPLVLKPWPGRGEGKRYLSLPIELWSNGWICVLSGRALALYLVLNELTTSRSNRGWTDRYRRELYGLSDATWARAAGELKEMGLLTITKKSVKDDSAVERERNIYELHQERLKTFTPRTIPRQG